MLPGSIFIMKNTMKKYKRILSLGLCLIMMLVFSGCKKNNTGNDDKALDKEGGYSQDEASNTKVMKVGEYDITLDEAMIYTLQYVYMQGMTADAMTDEKVTELKNSILDNIRQVKMIYDVACHNDYSLSEADMTTVTQAVANCKNMFTQELMDKYGISDEALERVFTEQYTVEQFTAYIKNDMKSRILEDLEKAYEDYQFISLTFIRFPTVEIEDEMPKKDEDGNYIYLSEEEKLKMQEKAQSALKDLQSGMEYNQVMENYGVKAYSYDNTGYIGGYSDELNARLENMQVGDFTDIMDDDLGYCIVVMTAMDDGTTKATYVNMQAEEVLKDEFDTLQGKWLSTISIDTENDLYDTVWIDFDIKLLTKDMEQVTSK